MGIFGPSEAMSWNQSICSRVVTRASLSAKPESAAAPTIPAIFGPSSPVSFAFFDPDTSYWKTSQATFLLGLDQFSETWPDSGTMRNGCVFERQTSALPTCESESSSWLTPHGMHGTDHTVKTGRGGEFAAQATQWQTPAVDSVRSRGGDRKDEQGLDQQARFFPTPAQRDYRTPNKRSFQERGGESKGEQLQNFVEHSPLVPTLPHGPKSSEPGPTSRLRLNPRFVEWLMGFPPSWTEL